MRGGECGGAAGRSGVRVPVDAGSGAAPGAHLSGFSRAGRVAGSPGLSPRPGVPSRPGVAAPWQGGRVTWTRASGRKQPHRHWGF